MTSNLTKIAISICLLLLAAYSTTAQNKQYADSCLNILCSKQFHGRGFTHNGDKITANFIVAELKNTKAKPLNKSFFQKFNVSINTFPDSIYLELSNHKKLKLGDNFLVNPISSSVNGKFNCLYLSTSNKKINYANKCVIIDPEKLNNNLIQNLKYNNYIGAKIFIELKSNKLMQEQSTIVKNWAWLEVKKEFFDSTTKNIKINLTNKFIPKYETQNIIAKIKGNTDSTIMFIAHYDHLGEVGQALFPGMNDNGSGVVTLLDLAHYYSTNKPKYTIIFLFTSAEELGLIGSKYFFEHPLINLEKTKIIINLDVIGSGEKGIAIVNGKNQKKITDKIKKINNSLKLFNHIKIRNNAPNGDHYFFAAAGLPAIFIYTEGNYLEYHSVNDNNKNLIFPKYNQFFTLITKLLEN